MACDTLSNLRVNPKMIQALLGHVAWPLLCTVARVPIVGGPRQPPCIFWNAGERSSHGRLENRVENPQVEPLTMPENPVILRPGRVPLPVGRAGFKPVGGRAGVFGRFDSCLFRSRLSGDQNGTVPVTTVRC